MSSPTRATSLTTCSTPAPRRRTTRAVPRLRPDRSEPARASAHLKLELAWADVLLRAGPLEPVARVQSLRGVVAVRHPQEHVRVPRVLRPVDHRLDEQISHAVAPEPGIHPHRRNRRAGGGRLTGSATTDRPRDLIIH